MLRQLEEFKNAGEDINQLLGIIAQNTKKTIEQLNNLRIQKGRRVVEGQTARGFRQDLTSEDAKTLKTLLYQAADPNKAPLYEDKIPNYEIKLDDDILFRQERDGTVTVNQIELEPELQTERPFTYKDAFSPEWDPWIEPEADLDFDGYGLSDTEEIAKGTDPLNSDTGRDGIGDASDSHPYNLALERDSAPSINQDDIPPAIRVAERDVAKLPEGKTKGILKSIVRQLSEKVKTLSSALVQKVSNYPQWNRERETANTALELFNRNYEQNKQTAYQSVDYNIILKGLNNYEVNDKRGNRLISFQKTSMGIKVTQSNLSGRDYAHFQQARHSLREDRGILNAESERRLAQLQALAPQSDREIVFAIKTKEVENTANRFLHYMGTQKWDAGEQGNYNIERPGERNFKIISKADGRGVVFERQGDKITNNLTAKDFQHFQNLGATLDNRLQKMMQQQKTLISHQRTQKTDRERELTI